VYYTRSHVMTTALEKLKQKYTDQIKKMESELERLRSKLSVVEEVDADERSLDLNLGSTKYAGKGMTEAVFMAVHELGKAGATAGQVRRHILANGFQSASQNIAVSVGTTLKRLAEKGKINGDLIDGKRIYKPS